MATKKKEEKRGIEVINSLRDIVDDYLRLLLMSGREAPCNLCLLYVSRYEQNGKIGYLHMLQIFASIKDALKYVHTIPSRIGRHVTESTIRRDKLSILVNLWDEELCLFTSEGLPDAPIQTPMRGIVNNPLMNPLMNLPF